MEELDERIALHRAMMDGGLIEEVRALIDVGLREAKTASRADTPRRLRHRRKGTDERGRGQPSRYRASAARRQVGGRGRILRNCWTWRTSTSNEAVVRHVVELTQREARAALTLVTRAGASVAAHPRLRVDRRNTQLPAHARVVKAHGAGNFRRCHGPA